MGELAAFLRTAGSAPFFAPFFMRGGVALNKVMFCGITALRNKIAKQIGQHDFGKLNANPMLSKSFERQLKESLTGQAV